MSAMNDGDLALCERTAPLLSVTPAQLEQLFRATPDVRAQRLRTLLTDAWHAAERCERTAAQQGQWSESAKQDALEGSRVRQRVQRSRTDCAAAAAALRVFQVAEVPSVTTVVRATCCVS